jgi:hypothetical protein
VSGRGRIRVDDADAHLLIAALTTHTDDLQRRYLEVPQGVRQRSEALRAQLTNAISRMAHDTRKALTR